MIFIPLNVSMLKLYSFLSVKEIPNEGRGKKKKGEQNLDRDHIHSLYYT